MRKNIGTVLIVLSLVLLIFIYYPIVQLYLFPAISSVPTSGSYIQIPKINAAAPIIENVDPFNEEEYKEALKKGVASAKDHPNFIFAHSSLPPWEMTRINTAFLRLGELKAGDQIKIIKDGQELNYMVSGKKEVWPNEVQYLQASQSELVLQTCTPLGSSLKRLLIFANPS